MQRRFGVEAAPARGQLQREQATGASEPFEPLPAPTGSAPYHLELTAVDPAAAAGDTVGLFIIGDSGGIKDPAPQLAVAKALAADQARASAVYSVGDVIYFNGAQSEYAPQFYEPYADVTLPFFAIPGNHDGDPEGDGEASLQAFVANFCASSPALPPKAAEFQRTTMDQPNVYWTLTDERFTLIGLYSNVPSGGVIADDQAEWLLGELRDAPTDRPLIVALHHPPYSCDAHHGGSAAMGGVLDGAFVGAERWPELVLSGHVHDYQRFNRVLHPGHSCTYVVAGASGYHNLHTMAAGVSKGMIVEQKGEEVVALEAYEDRLWGYLVLVVSKAGVMGEYVGVDRDGTVYKALDKFSIESAA